MTVHAAKTARAACARHGLDRILACNLPPLVVRHGPHVERIVGMITHGRVALREPPPTDRPLIPALRPMPQAGDVLASKRSARADVFTICVVSGADDKRTKRYEEAIDRVLELAHELQVDGWFTCNHTHYARIANFRQRVRPGSSDRDPSS